MGFTHVGDDVLDGLIKVRNLCLLCASDGEDAASLVRAARAISTMPTASRAGLYRADQDDSLGAFLKPELTPPERAVAQIEGWILGVM
jgi:hypothetical protein